VEARIAGVEKDATSLLADVGVVATYKRHNLKRSKLENLFPAYVVMTNKSASGFRLGDEADATQAGPRGGGHDLGDGFVAR
jgi:hypothetical protein